MSLNSEAGPSSSSPTDHDCIKNSSEEAKSFDWHMNVDPGKTSCFDAFKVLKELKNSITTYTGPDDRDDYYREWWYRWRTATETLIQTQLPETDSGGYQTCVSLKAARRIRKTQWRWDSESEAGKSQKYTEPPEWKQLEEEESSEFGEITPVLSTEVEEQWQLISILECVANYNCTRHRFR